MFLFFVFSLKLWIKIVVRFPCVCQLCALFGTNWSTPCQPKSRRFYTYVIVTVIPLLISAFKSLQIITLPVSFPGIMVLHNFSNNAPIKKADFKIRIIIVRINIFYVFFGGCMFSFSLHDISTRENYQLLFHQSKRKRWQAFDKHFISIEDNIACLLWTTKLTYNIKLENSLLCILLTLTFRIIHEDFEMNCHFLSLVENISLACHSSSKAAFLRFLKSNEILWN